MDNGQTSRGALGKRPTGHGGVNREHGKKEENKANSPRRGEDKGGAVLGKADGSMVALGFRGGTT